MKTTQTDTQPSNSLWGRTLRQMAVALTLVPVMGGALTLTSVVAARDARAAIEVAFEEDDQLPLVYVSVALRAGAVTDPKDQAGLTRFVSEMVLRGTKKRDKEQINLLLDQLGSSLEVETRSESTIFRGAVLKDSLPEYMDLMYEILTQPSFPEREIKKLKAETISALLELRGNDRSLAQKHFREFLFDDHPYSKNPLGTIGAVERFNREQVQAFYDRIFREKRFLVVGTGDTSKSALDAWAKKLAQARPGGDEPKELADPAMPQKRKLQIVDKPDRTQTWIYAGHVGVRPTDESYFPLYVANHAYGGGSFSARMMTEIRAKRGWSYGAYSYFLHGTEPHSWQFMLFPASKYTPEALDLALKMATDFKTKGLSAEEFEFARTSLINSDGFRYDTPKKRAENILEERLLNLPDGFNRTYGENLKKVSLEDANKAVAKFLNPDNFAITVLATAKDLKSKLAKAAGVPEKDVKVTDFKE